LPVPVMETITISSDGLFAFDKATLNPSALSRLDELTASIKEMGIGLEQVNLIGHTDRLRSDGRPERNRILSEQRAESIKRYLVSKGIPADKIHASGMGSTQPVVQCSTKASKEKQIACLQPNRRVEIILRGKNAVDEKRNK
jgi:OOP family OmpA-OmpF porin